MNWSELEEMTEDGITFGLHTRNHRILKGLSEEEIRQEIEIPPALSEKKGFIPVLSYPNGDYDEQVKGLAKEMGYRAAFTTQGGWIRPGRDDLFALKRVGVHQDISSSPGLFGLHLFLRGGGWRS